MNKDLNIGQPGHSIDDHFPHMGKMVNMGSGVIRKEEEKKDKK